MSFHRSSRSPIVVLLLAVAAFGLAACTQKPDQQGASVPATTAPAAGDAYDQSKMDFKPGPAKLSAERHTGAFAAGSALSMDAALKPLVRDTARKSGSTRRTRSSKLLRA